MIFQIASFNFQELNDTTSSQGFDIIVLFDYLITLALIVAVVSLYFITTNLRRRLKNLKGRLSSLKRQVDQITFEQRKNRSSQNSQKKNPNSRSGSHTVEQKEMKERNVDYAVQTHHPDSAIFEESESPTIELDVKSNIKYSQAPYDENKFYAPEVTSQPAADSLYEIDGNSIVLFKDASQKTWREALNFAEKHIRYACQIQNVKEDHHTRMVTVQPGEVELEGQDYIVKKKIGVRYE